MTEEIINSDGSRNWQANILLDNIKRLEQENKELKETIKQYCEWLDEARRNEYFWCDKCTSLEQENKALQAYKDINEDFKKAWDELNEKYKQLRSALEEIKRTVMDIIEDNGRHNLSDFSSPIRIEKIINEVLK